MAKTARLKQRYAAEARFKLYGKLAIADEIPYKHTFDSIFTEGRVNGSVSK